MKNVMKRRIAEETMEINGRLSLSEWKLMIMMMMILILGMFLYIVASKLIN